MKYILTLFRDSTEYGLQLAVTKRAKLFMVTWNGRLPICDMVMQIQGNIWYIYESLDLKVTCGYNVVDYSRIQPKVGETTTLKGFVHNVTIGLIINIHHTTLLATKAILVLTKQDLFTFKDEINIQTNEFICIHAHGSTPNKMQSTYDVLGKHAKGHCKGQHLSCMTRQ